MNEMFDCYCPGLSDELKGFAQAVAADENQLYYYAGTCLTPGCSLLAVLPGLTKDGHVLVARNYEFSHRLSIASQKLLHSDRKIIDIALESGFDSPESFSRAFKNVYQVSPSVYRQNRLDIFPGNKTMIDREFLHHIFSLWERIPAGKYAVFTHRGHLSDILKTYQYIWGTWAGLTDETIDNRDDFELYDERFAGRKNDSSEIDIYIFQSSSLKVFSPYRWICISPGMKQVCPWGCRKIKSGVLHTLFGIGLFMTC